MTVQISLFVDWLEFVWQDQQRLELLKKSKCFERKKGNSSWEISTSASNKRGYVVKSAFVTMLTVCSDAP